MKHFFPSSIYKILLVFSIAVPAVFILFSRRGSVITNPQVWNEDGKFIIPQFFEDGWMSLAEPVQGYLVTIPRLISNTALTFAPGDYPFSSTLLAWAFSTAVAVYIVMAPTMLKGRLFLSLSCFLIPVDPETFGTPLYTFWWAGLILILLPLWELKPGHLNIRFVSLLLCGLSSPLIVLATPLMVACAYYLRSRVEFFLLAVAVVCIGIQL